MANHGVVAYGADLHQAYMKMETVEHFAKISLVAHILGHEQPLNDMEVAKLVEARSRYAGAKSAAPMPVQPQNGACGRDNGSTTVDKAQPEEVGAGGRRR
jgi:L-fuculose-phosphate aldolase